MFLWVVGDSLEILATGVVPTSCTLVIRETTSGAFWSILPILILALVLSLIVVIVIVVVVVLSLIVILPTLVVIFGPISVIIVVLLTGILLALILRTLILVLLRWRVVRFWWRRWLSGSLLLA